MGFVDYFERLMIRHRRHRCRLRLRLRRLLHEGSATGRPLRNEVMAFDSLCSRRGAGFRPVFPRQRPDHGQSMLGCAPALRTGSGAGGSASLRAQAPAMALHRAGKLRVLAVNAPARLEAAPEIPTATEEGLANFV